MAVRALDFSGPNHPGSTVPRPSALTSRKSFCRWGLPAVAGVLLIIVIVMMRRTGGHLVYVIDDPAIHLSMAKTLVETGTWGVQAGEFASASSSPAWTLVLAGFTFVLPTGIEFVPLLLNVGASAWVVFVLDRSQRLLRPVGSRWMDRAATAALLVVACFLPGLAITGMEHTAHAALVVTVVWLVHRSDLRNDGRIPCSVYLLLAVAALTRFETLFVAGGLAVAVLARAWTPLGPPSGRRPTSLQLRRAAACLLAAGIPVAAFSLFNRAMGQGLLPNSVMAKTALGNGEDTLVPGFLDFFEALAQDPLVLALTAIALGYLIWQRADGSRRQVVPCVTLVIAVTAHTAFADYGWFERYQGYLVVVGIYVGLGVGTEVVSPRNRRALVLMILVFSLILAPVKLHLLTDAALASDNTYRQRYQLGLFLARYYQGRSIATGELGYPTLFHDGPVLDLLGLGSADVLDARRRGRDGPEFWRRIVREHGAEVVAVYPATLGADVPRSWELVGEWTMGPRTVTVIDSKFQFWAPGRRFVEPLRDHFEDFTDELPGGVEATCWSCLRELSEEQRRELR